MYVLRTVCPGARRAGRYHDVVGALVQAMKPAVFVTRHYGQARGGLGRYEESLLPALTARWPVQAMPVQALHVPAGLSLPARLLGIDLRAVARNYPCRLRGLPESCLVHLSNQNMGLALLANRIETSVVTVHDLFTLCRAAEGDNSSSLGMADTMLARLSALCIKKASRVIAVSEFTKKEVVERLTVPPARVHVVYEGVDAQAFRPREVPQAFLAKYGLTRDRRYILYVGSLEPRKNLKRLCAAAGRVLAALKDVDLIIAGRGGTAGQEGLLRESIEDAGLSGRLRRLSFLPAAELPLLYNVGTVLALPSLGEGFGLPALEAMSCGCPVVASNATSIPEVVRDAGVMVNPLDVDALAQALLKALADAEHRQELRQRGLRRAQAFTWERAADETVAVYQRLVAT